MGTAKQHGITRGVAYWQPDFNASVDSDNKWEATHSFLSYIDSAPILIPSKGASCQEPGFSFLGYDRATIENYEGELAKVTCTFVGTTNPDATTDDEGNIIIPARIEYSISTSQEPIETHPNFTDLTDDERLLVQAFKESRLKPTQDTIVDGVIEFIYKDETEKSQKVSLEGAALNLVQYLASGVTDYLAVNSILRVTTNEKTLPSNILDGVGNIDLPPLRVDDVVLPNAPDGRNWLYGGAQTVSEGSSHSITKEWIMSGPAGWDGGLYESNPVVPTE